MRWTQDTCANCKPENCFFTTDFLSSSSLGCEFEYFIRCNGSSVVDIFYGRHSTFYYCFRIKFNWHTPHTKKRPMYTLKWLANDRCSISLQIFVFDFELFIRLFHRHGKADRKVFLFLFICARDLVHEMRVWDINRIKQYRSHKAPTQPILFFSFFPSCVLCIDDAFPSAIQRLPSTFHAFNFHWQWTGIKFASKSEKIWKTNFSSFNFSI